MPIDCKDAVAEMGRAFACNSSFDAFTPLASLGTCMLRRKVESTMVIRVFFILSSG
jgi:hypothetical protein